MGPSAAPGLRLAGNFARPKISSFLIALEPGPHMDRPGGLSGRDVLALAWGRNLTRPLPYPGGAGGHVAGIAGTGARGRPRTRPTFKDLRKDHGNSYGNGTELRVKPAALASTPILSFSLERPRLRHKTTAQQPQPHY